MISPSGTFQYEIVIPRRARPWRAKDRSGAGWWASGDPIFQNRLVGLRPRVELLGNRIRLQATERSRAAVAEASLELDPELLQGLRPGDSLHLARTGSTALAASLCRRHELVFALGAVTSTLLGSSVEVRNTALGTPLEPERARVLVRVGSESVELGADETAVELGAYLITVFSGYIDETPGDDEVVALTRKQGLRHDAVERSARCVSGSLQMTDW